MMDENQTCADCEITFSESDKLTHYASEEEKAELAAEAENKWALKGRFRSWALWTAVIGLVSVIFSAFGVWEKIGIDSETFRGIAAAIGSVLSAFGILNNPTDGGAF